MVNFINSECFKNQTLGEILTPLANLFVSKDITLTQLALEALGATVAVATACYSYHRFRLLNVGPLNNDVHLTSPSEEIPVDYPQDKKDLNSIVQIGIPSKDNCHQMIKASLIDEIVKLSSIQEEKDFIKKIWDIASGCLIASNSLIESKKNLTDKKAEFAIIERSTIVLKTLLLELKKSGILSFRKVLSKEKNAYFENTLLNSAKAKKNHANLYDRFYVPKENKILILLHEIILSAIDRLNEINDEKNPKNMTKILARHRKKIERYKEKLLLSVYAKQLLPRFSSEELLILESFSKTLKNSSQLKRPNHIKDKKWNDFLENKEGWLFALEVKGLNKRIQQLLKERPPIEHATYSELIDAANNLSMVISN